jgi:hypothetical protein
MVHKIEKTKKTNTRLSKPFKLMIYMKMKRMDIASVIITSLKLQWQRLDASEIWLHILQECNVKLLLQYDIFGFRLCSQLVHVLAFEILSCNMYRKQSPIFMARTLVYSSCYSLSCLVCPCSRFVFGLEYPL